MSEAAITPRPLVPLPGRVAVLLSGRGSNFEALARACEVGAVPARITVVISDRADALGLSRAAEHGIPRLALVRLAGESRASHEARIEAAFEAHGADLVCLAGFMRLLSPDFVGRHSLRILNIHPSLLPAFPGLDAQGQAVRYGARVSGATVHLVDAGMDSGPIVLQESVPVHPDDDAGRLAGRILEVEHMLYPRALGLVLAGGWAVEGRRFIPATNPSFEGLP